MANDWGWSWFLCFSCFNKFMDSEVDFSSCRAKSEFCLFWFFFGCLDVQWNALENTWKLYFSLCPKSFHIDFHISKIWAKLFEDYPQFSLSPNSVWSNMHRFHMIFELLTDFVDFDNFVILVSVYVLVYLAAVQEHCQPSTWHPTCRLLTHCSYCSMSHLWLGFVYIDFRALTSNNLQMLCISKCIIRRIQSNLLK